MRYEQDGVIEFTPAPMLREVTDAPRNIKRITFRAFVRSGDDPFMNGNLVPPSDEDMNALAEEAVKQFDPSWLNCASRGVLHMFSAGAYSAQMGTLGFGPVGSDMDAEHWEVMFDLQVSGGPCRNC